MSAEQVVIIGGGTIGLSIAEHLTQRGVRPTIIDRQAFAGEASWASSGFLDLRVASERGKSFFDLCKLSCELYPEWVARIHRDSGIDPEYVHSKSFDLVFDDEDDKAVIALEKTLGSFGVSGEWLSGDEVRSLEPRISSELLRAFYLEHPCQVRPPRLNRGLLAVLQQRGANLVEHAEATDFRIQGRSIREVVTVRGSFKTSQVILACGPWTPILSARLDCSIPSRPIRGQALMIRDFPGSLRHILFGINWYVVPRRDGRTFIGSTVEDVGFVKATTPFGMQKLTRLAIRSIPDFAAAPVERSWSGLRPGTHDGLPYLGRVPHLENVWIACGHFTHGIVLSPATGLLIAQAVLGEKTDLDLTPFSLERIQSATEADSRPIRSFSSAF